MKKKLRLTSLIMLIVGVVYVGIAIMCMDVPIDIPNWFFPILLKIYKIYPITTAGIFVLSFFVKDDKDKTEDPEQK